MTRDVQAGVCGGTITREGLGGSDMYDLAKGNWPELYDKITGAVEPEDLTWKLPVQIGLTTEALNIHWFSHEVAQNRRIGRDWQIHANHRKSMPAIAHCGSFENERGQETYRSLVAPWQFYTPDALIVRPELGASDLLALLECKHTNEHNTIENLCHVYAPQMTWGMIVTGARSCYMSGFFGNRSHDWAVLDYDFGFAANLLNKAAEFWSYVKRRERPPAPPPISNRPAARVKGAKAYGPSELPFGNEWVSLVHDWLTTKADADRHAETTDKLKVLARKAPVDCKEIRTEGMVATINRAGISLKALEKVDDEAA